MLFRSSVEQALQVGDSEDEEEGIERPKTYDVVLRAKPEKASQIKAQMVEGKRCLIIPLDEDEFINVNGVDRKSVV